MAGASLQEELQLSTNIKTNRRVVGTQSFNLSAGSEGAVTLEALQGVGTLEINGSWSAATPSTGPTSGTAQAGTSTTQLVKSSGTTAWTTNNLRGMYLRVTSGAATGSVRPIRSNAAHTANVHAIPGLAAGDTWELVRPGTTITTLTVKRCAAGVKVSGCVIQTLVSEDNLDVWLNGCDVNGSSTRDRRLRAHSCVNTGQLDVRNANECEVLNGLGGDVGWQVLQTNEATFEVDVDDASATPVYIESCQLVRVGVKSANNTGDGLECRGCQRVEPYGEGISGSGNSGYGVRVGGGGYYVMDGATATGTAGDFIVEALSDTWANLATYESYSSKGAALVLGG